jgi:hypothetical protein
LPSIIEALADCLEALRRGERMEACLEMYAEYRDELKPLLQVASLLRPLPPEIVPSPLFKERTRVQILDRHEGADESSLAPDRPSGKL